MIDDTIKSTKQLAQYAAELTDEEVGDVGQMVFALQQKYSARANTVENLEMLRDEALTKFAEMGILATFDPSPCFYGEPPVLEIIGRVGDPGFKKETDHEKKQWEVRRATELGEDYRGQKESYNKRRDKK